MKKNFLILGLIFGLSINVSIAKAADEAVNEAVNEAATDEDLEYTYGSVISVSPTEIVVNEYDYEADQEVQATYVVNAETKYSNVTAGQDLVKDDNVDIYYKVIDGKKIASMITKDETVYESETGESDEAIDAMTDLPDNSIDPSANPEPETQNMVVGNEAGG